MKKLFFFAFVFLFFATLAHAEGEVYTGTLSGTILDTRTAPEPTPGQYSENDEYNYFRAVDMGPSHVLIGDGTNHVHPLYSYGSSFFGTASADPDPNVDYFAPYTNQHVRVSGDITTGSSWPSISKITNIEKA